MSLRFVFITNNSRGVFHQHVHDFCMRQIQTVPQLFMMNNLNPWGHDFIVEWSKSQTNLPRREILTICASHKPKPPKVFGIEISFQHTRFQHLWHTHIFEPKHQTTTLIYSVANTLGGTHNGCMLYINKDRGDNRFC